MTNMQLIHKAMGDAITKIIPAKTPYIMAKGNLLTFMALWVHYYHPSEPASRNGFINNHIPFYCCKKLIKVDLNIACNEGKIALQVAILKFLPVLLSCFRMVDHL